MFHIKKICKSQREVLQNMGARCEKFILNVHLKEFDQILELLGYALKSCT